MNDDATMKDIMNEELKKVNAGLVAELNSVKSAYRQLAAARVAAAATAWDLVTAPARAAWALERVAARKRAVDVAWRQSGEIPVQAYTGVTCMPSERWKARALKKYIGTYDTAKDAADAVDAHYKLMCKIPIKGFNSTIPTRQQRPT